MTVSTDASKISYAGNGSATQFAVPFKFLSNAHIRAVLREAGGGETVWTEGADYTLAGAGVEGGGTLTASAAPANGTVLLIKRVVPEAQAVDLPLGGALSSATVEEMVDRLTMMVQQHSEEIARAILFKETSATTGVVLPEPEADKVLGWNAAADNLENKEVGAGGAGTDDHGELQGLGDDDHTHYLLASGARALSGTLDMGGNDIENVGTVDGRDVSADGTKLDGIETGAEVNDITSVHGRTGAVVAQAGDYEADQVEFTPAGAIAATDVQSAIEELGLEKATLGEVASVASKTGNYTLIVTDDVNVSSVITDLSKSWCRAHQRDQGGGGTVAEDDFSSGELVDAAGTETLRLHREAAVSDIVDWECVQFDDCTVQRGTVTLASGATSDTLSITAVDQSRTFLLCGVDQEGQSGGGGRMDILLPRVRLTADDTVTVDRASSGAAVNVRVQVIEFTAASGITVQKLSSAFAAADGQNDHALTPLGGLDKAAATCSVNGSTGKTDYSASDIAGEAFFTPELTSTTNLQVKRNSTNGAADVEVYVIDFAPPGGGGGAVLPGTLMMGMG